MPVFSKVFERILYNRIISFLENNKIISDNQYGLRKKRSTIDAVLLAMESIRESLDKRTKPSCTMIDLTKAFDTVNHRRLIRKCEMSG